MLLEQFLQQNKKKWNKQQHFLTEIHIKHVRHLKNIDIPLSKQQCKHLILTGKNGSGKTSVLEALAAYLSRFLLNVRVNESYDYMKNHEIPELENVLKTKKNDLYQQQKLKETLSGEHRHIDKIYQGVTATFDKDKEVNVEALNGNFVLAYYQAEREYSAQNEDLVQKIELQDAYSIDTGRRSRTPGREFVKYILNLKTIGAMAAESKNEKRAAEVREWFVNFDKILKLIFEDESAHLEFDIETFEFHIIVSGRDPFTFDTLSSGYAAILDIVVDLMMRMEKKAGKHYDLSGVVLIDEIEAHLHLAMQKKILPILTELFSNIQFIVTTHSPFILNSISNVVIYDLEKHTLINADEGLSNVPYDGIVEGYFDISSLSDKLKKKFDRYKSLTQKKKLTDDEFEEIADLEHYLDETPDYLGLDFMPDYKRLKLEFEQREG